MASRRTREVLDATHSVQVRIDLTFFIICRFYVCCEDMVLLENFQFECFRCADYFVAVDFRSTHDTIEQLRFGVIDVANNCFRYR